MGICIKKEGDLIMWENLGCVIWADFKDVRCPVCGEKSYRKFGSYKRRPSTCLNSRPVYIECIRDGVFAHIEYNEDHSLKRIVRHYPTETKVHWG